MSRIEERREEKVNGYIRYYREADGTPMVLRLDDYDDLIFMPDGLHIRATKTRVKSDMLTKVTIYTVPIKLIHGFELTSGMLR